MAEAIDHNTLIKVARQGQALPLCTDHGQAFVPGYQADAPCPKFDPADANSILDQDGWVKGADGIRAKNGQRLEFHYSTTSGKPWRADDEQIIQSNFKDIGIQLDIQNYPADTFFGPFLNGGKHQLAEFENAYVYDADDDTLLGCDQIPPPGGQGQNWSFYCNPQLTKLIAQEEGSADPAVRQQAFNGIHQVELTDFPIIILYSPADLALVKSTGHNYLPVGVWQWWCTGGQC
jgi:peptide/nickel transport system substrate-binding protein